MGRPRKSTAALERSGNLRADRHAGRKNEPKFDGAPAKPPTLTKDAADHWDLIVPGLVESGIAKAIDGPALALMCEAFADYMAARREEAWDLKEKRQKQMLISSALRAWRDLAARFGMTPSDRAKLEVVPDGEETNPFAQLLQQTTAPPSKKRGRS